MVDVSADSASAGDCIPSTIPGYAYALLRWSALALALAVAFFLALAFFLARVPALPNPHQKEKTSEHVHRPVPQESWFKEKKKWESKARARQVEKS